jgi:hypothetical protein
MEQAYPTGNFKWVIIPVSVNGVSVVPIGYKIPANVMRCIGVAFSVREPVNFAEGNLIGEISLEFSNQQTHPVHMPVEHNPMMACLKEKVLSLDENLEGLVTGYFKSLTVSSFTLNVYLKCIARENH